jgi:IQ domain-containing protein G
LKRKIAYVKLEREVEIKKRSEMIAHLKDQLQEMKAKTAMEGKYVKKVCDVSVAQTQKRCQLTEKAIHSEIEVGLH